MNHLLTMMIEFFMAELRAAEHWRNAHSQMIDTYRFRARVAQDAGHPAPGDKYSHSMVELNADIGEAERIIMVLKKLKISDQDT